MLRRATNLKATFNYHARLDTAAKIDLRLDAISRAKTNRKRLVRFQGREKLSAANAFKLTTCAPFGQSRGDFIENYYTRYDRRSGEMPRQAGMIGANHAANFKAHLRPIFSHCPKLSNWTALL
jgi:hypothetical protein